MNPNANLTINAAKLRQYADKYNLKFKPAENVYADYMEDVVEDVGEPVVWVAVDKKHEQLFGFVTETGEVYLIPNRWLDFEDYTRPPANWDPEDTAFAPKVET